MSVRVCVCVNFDLRPFRTEQHVFFPSPIIHLLIRTAFMYRRLVVHFYLNFVSYLDTNTHADKAPSDRRDEFYMRNVRNAKN